MIFIEIVFPHTPQPFTYTSKEKLEVGDLVEAPLRNHTINGIVVEILKEISEKSVKTIARVVRKNVLTANQIKLAKFIRVYYAAHFGKVLKLMIPKRIWEDRPLKRKAKETAIKKISQNKKELTPAQEKVLKKLLETADWKLPTLLHGITGSGKTEIYLQIILEVLQADKSAILLVPEIALTPQLVGYFAASVPKEKIAVIHSNLSEGEKINTWERIHSGKIKLVIGSRSALFAPAQNLGAIILDEEHEWNYKNDQTPRYHARGVAMHLADLEKAKLILGSATPSLESYYFANKGRIQLLELPERIGNSRLPQVSIVDLRNEIKRENFSPFSEALQKKIHEKLERKEQIILLLNKRGFNSSVVCRDCGFVLGCQSCSLPLTFHRVLNKCMCHSCGYQKAPPVQCPNCHSAVIRYLGTGTQKIESELPKLFPNARVLRADRDTTTLRGAHQEIYDHFRKGKADILIGTQIIAKGLDLPNVSLVGVLLADIGLHLPDFRSGEKVFSLLTQVAGRCGRGNIPGEVVIQTYTPEHPAIIAARTHDYKKFYATEILERKNTNWPPFKKIVKFIFVDVNEQNAKTAAQKFMQQLQYLGETQVWLAPALIAKLHNKYHYHVIWKGGDPRKLLAKISSLDGVRVDVDPVNLG
jgi:primosomal protein N' (replication factor Y) (superfamily II helicase)